MEGDRFVSDVPKVCERHGRFFAKQWTCPAGKVFPPPVRHAGSRARKALASHGKHPDVQIPANPLGGVVLGRGTTGRRSTTIGCPARKRGTW